MRIKYASSNIRMVKNFPNGNVAKALLFKQAAKGVKNCALIFCWRLSMAFPPYKLDNLHFFCSIYCFKVCIHDIIEQIA